MIAVSRNFHMAPHQDWTAVDVSNGSNRECGLEFWLSGADDPIARAEEVRRASVEQLGRAGVAASGDTGESDPVEAIQDALQT